MCLMAFYMPKILRIESILFCFETNCMSKHTRCTRIYARNKCWYICTTTSETTWIRLNIAMQVYDKWIKYYTGLYMEEWLCQNDNTKVRYSNIFPIMVYEFPYIAPRQKSIAENMQNFQIT